MIKIYLLFPIMTLLGALGGFFFKKGANNLNFTKIKTVFLNYNLYIGGIFYVIAALLNIVTLKFLPYNIVLPLTAMTYIWTIIIAKFTFNESINRNKVIGIILIVIGSVFIAIR